MKKRTLSGDRKRELVAWSFVVPYFLIFFIFTVLPVCLSLLLSFTSFNLLEMPKFIGASNYNRLFFGDRIFMKAVGNTFVLALITGPVSYVLCLLFAWFINELKPVARAVVTLLFYAPAISGNIYLVWQMLFSSDSYGYINGMLMNLGLINQPVLWLKDPRYVLIIIAGVAIWTSLGTSFLSFIAGFQGIDRSYYEAGAVDGIHNRLQELWYVTLPLMKPQLLFGAVMSITASFGVGSIVTAMAGFPTVNYAAHTIINHLEDYGTVRFEMGYASAIATVLFAIMILSNVLVRNLIEKVGT